MENVELCSNKHKFRWERSYERISKNDQHKPQQGVILNEWGFA